MSQQHMTQAIGKVRRDVFEQIKFKDMASQKKAQRG